MKRLNLTVILYLCLVFASGVAVGAVAFSLYNTRSVSARPSHDELLRRYREELRTRLKLTPGQFDQLSTILDSTHQGFKQLRERWQPEVKALQERQTEQIRAILNDQQRIEYEKMRQERERRRQQRSHSGKTGC